MNPVSREVAFWLSGSSFPSDPYIQVFQNKPVQDTPRQPTCGHFPPDCARLLISSTVFLRESWSARDTNTGRMYFIRAEREGGVLVGGGARGGAPPPGGSLPAVPATGSRDRTEASVDSWEPHHLRATDDKAGERQTG